ncbi:hypothetical protein [Streptomyces indicus]|uniref:PknH-like extracellular domain-containing protein n=1 Tax=Streptomyces indicus TaxID=417292 RepID=A0A1G8T2B9_9ACTN|nr:hypothetical protein [Streptomyces indicus]SDJ35561.1 hypothetical protein SAMN05421806_1019 [Streptomyces indicus]
MSKRIRTGAYAALAVAALTAGATLAAPAAGATPKEAAAKAAAAKAAVTKAAVTKAASPAFLSPSQLPPHPSSTWTAGPVTEGFPEQLGTCVSTEGVPSYAYRHREFRTDLDTGAVQLTVVADTSAHAAALAKHYDDLIRTCPGRIEQGSPEVQAQGRDYGKLAVEEGARVRGVHTETSWGAIDISLYSVGRDGRTVTVVQWGQMGDFADAPVAAFRKTTTAAVNKLY